MDRAELATKSRDELADIATKLKIKVHHKHTAETLINKISQQPQAYQNAAVDDPVAPVVVFSNTKEEILAALGPRFTGKEGFKIDFPGDNTVIFTYRGISESVNMSVPMKVIKRQAEMAAKVKYAPAMAKDGSGGKIMMA